MLERMSVGRMALIHELAACRSSVEKRQQKMVKEASEPKNKENFVSLQKKRISSRIIKIEFPICKPRKEPPILTPLVQANNNILLKQTISAEVNQKKQPHTQRVKGWRLRRQNFDTLHTHCRKRTLNQRQLLRQRDNFVKKEEAEMFHRLQGWQNDNLSEESDCNMLLKYCKKL